MKVRIEEVMLEKEDRHPTYFVDYDKDSTGWENHSSYRNYDKALEDLRKLRNGEIVV